MTSEEFKAIRDKLELSTAETAFVLNVTVRAIQYWESGTKPINPIAARAMTWFERGFRPAEWPK